MQWSHSTAWFVADPAIRAEVTAVPQDDRFMHLARADTVMLTNDDHAGGNEGISLIPGNGNYNIATDEKKHIYRLKFPAVDQDMKTDYYMFCIFNAFPVVRMRRKQAP